MTETTQEERDHMRNFTGDSPEAMIHHKLVRDADRLAQAEALLQEVWWDCQHIDARERIRAFLGEDGE